MPRIDWFYARKHCESCDKARAFIAEHGVEVAATADGKTERYGPDDLGKVLRGVKRLVVVRGTAVTEFAVGKGTAADPEVRKKVIGPTGNLRAPTARVGSTLYVGFAPGVYAQIAAG